MNLNEVESIHKEMLAAKKKFFNALDEYEKENGKAVVGSIIKSKCCNYRNRKFKVFEVVPAMSRFTDAFDVRTYYRAKILDGKGNEVHGKVVRFDKSDFDVIER